MMIDNVIRRLVHCTHNSVSKIFRKFICLQIWIVVCFNFVIHIGHWLQLVRHSISTFTHLDLLINQNLGFLHAARCYFVETKRAYRCLIGLQNGFSIDFLFFNSLAMKHTASNNIFCLTQICDILPRQIEQKTFSRNLHHKI